MPPTSTLIPRQYSRPFLFGLVLALITVISGSAGPAVLAQSPEAELQPLQSDLALGDRSPAVRRLQKLLNQVPDLEVAPTGPGSPGQETQYFGQLTQQAVITFQERYADEILAPWGLSRGTGFVGRTTREKLDTWTGGEPAETASAEELRQRIAELQSRIEALQNQGSSGETNPDSSDRTPNNDFYLPGEEDPAEGGGKHRLPQPFILDLDPEEGPHGTQITLRGRNFALQDNTVIINLGNTDNYPVVSSDDGQELTFRLETETTQEINDQLQDASENDIERIKESFPPEIPIQLKVRNFLGESNTATFTLTPFSDL